MLCYNFRVMYEKKLIINSNDIDNSYTLRVSSLLRLMQSVVMEHTEILKVGYEETSLKGISWVITRLNIKINRLPKYQEEIRCLTYPKDTKMLFYPRYFYIYDKDDNLLVSISSIWTLIDQKTRQVIINKEIGDRCVGETLNDEPPLPRKLEENTLLDIVASRHVLYSDIDLNNHLNFTKYMEYLLDTHNSSFFQKHSIKEVTLNFLKEIKEEDFVHIYHHFNKADNIESFSITDSNNVIHLLGEIIYH